MNTFYFNTGVKQQNRNFLLEGEVFRGGVLQIPFDCEAPETASLMFLCDNPNREDVLCENVKAYEVHNTKMVSKYAYFRLNQ